MEVMSNSEKVTRLKEHVESSLDYFVREHDLVVSDIIGILEMIKMDYYMQCSDDE